MRPGLRRTIRIAAAGVAVLLLAIVVIGWNVCWRSPPFYACETTVDLPVPIMTMDEYGRVSAEHPRPYIVEIDRGDGGGLLLYGSEHSVDPDHPQIADIETRWEAFGPTVALVEGRLGFFVEGFGDPVEKYGEVGKVNALARRDDVPVYTWEPPREREVEIVLRDFPARRVALFYVLRPYFSNKRHGNIDNPDVFVMPLLRERTTYPGLEGTLETIEDIDAMWGVDFAGEPDWRDTSDEHGLPGYLDDIFAASNAARDEHFAQVIVDLVRRGERVFAVAGSSHPVKMDAALRAILAEGDERETPSRALDRP